MNLSVKLMLVLAVGMVAGVLAFSWTCPCERLPGAYLFGDVAEEPVQDWAFANAAPLCQIEVRTWRPHSVNLNCMAAEGELYISCSNCAGKSWSQTALAAGVARIRIGELIYPVATGRVTEADELNKAWSARAQKLQRDATPRPEHWWSFHLSSI